MPAMLTPISVTVMRELTTRELRALDRDTLVVYDRTPARQLAVILAYPEFLRLQTRLEILEQALREQSARLHPDLHRIHQGGD